jgi:hypothetical protein
MIRIVFENFTDSNNLEVLLKLVFTSPKGAVFKIIDDFWRNVEVSLGPTSRISQFQENLSLNNLMVQYIVGMHGAY